MEPLRLQAVAARVVAWHNQHPLARPITAAHVYSIGFVALPFRSVSAAQDARDAAESPADGGGSLRERAMARARQGDAAPPTPAPPPQPAPADLRGAFTESFIPPLKPAQVARWAARHGRTLAEPPTQAPLRQVLEDAAAAAAAPHPLTLYVLTAAIEIGPRRTRVLLGGGNDPQILGRRLWDWPRMGGLSVAALLLVAGGAAGYHLFLGRAARADGASAVADAASAASAATAATSASEAGPADPPASAADGDHEGARPIAARHPAIEVAQVRAAASEPESALPHEISVPAVPDAVVERAITLPAPPVPASAAAGPLPPVEMAPRPGRIALPVLAQLIPESAKAQARAARRAREGVAPVEPGAPASSPAAAPPHEPVWAISTRPLRTRTEAEQVMAAMDGLLRPLGDPTVRTEILPQGDDWRVVGWPYTDRHQADRALSVLVARGMRVQVIGF